MAGRFDPSSILNGLNAMTENRSYEVPSSIVPDKRTRAEVREDFEKKLKALDKDAIEELKNKILG